MDPQIEKKLWAMATGFARWLGDSAISADDFYQEATAALFRAFGPHGHAAPASLMSRTARFAMIDLGRRDGSTIRYRELVGPKRKRTPPQRISIMSLENLSAPRPTALSVSDPNALLNTEDRLLWAASKASMWGLEILRMRARGLTLKEIGEQLHFTEGNICFILKKMKTLYNEGENHNKIPH